MDAATFDLFYFIFIIIFKVVFMCELGATAGGRAVVVVFNFFLLRNSCTTYGSST